MGATPGLLQLDGLPGLGDGSLVVQWDVLLATLTLLVIYLVFRARADVADAMGFTEADVALLTIGTLAAQVLNVPLATVGGAVFAVNLGGVLVPLILTVRLARRGTLSMPAALVGIALVAGATWTVVRVEPGVGAIVTFPDFFLPPAVALAYGFVVGRARPARAGPLAFAAGSLGALVGADLLLLPAFIDVAEQAPAGTALVLGGAGAFDLVFLAGGLALALSMVLALVTTRRPVGPVAGTARRPGEPRARRVANARAVVEGAHHLHGLTPRERSTYHLALANEALARGRGAQATKEAHAALDALLRAGNPSVLARLRAAPRAAGALTEELRLVTHRYRQASHREPAWHEACDTVELAKTLAARLWHLAPGQDRLSDLATEPPRGGPGSRGPGRDGPGRPASHGGPG